MKGRLMGAGLALVAVGAVALLPAGAQAQTSTNCSTSIRHVSNLAESGSRCPAARKIARYAEKHYTCKKGAAVVSFTLSN